MKKFMQIVCIIVSALIIYTPSFALVPVDKVNESDMKKSDHNKTLLYKNEKEKVKSETEEIKNRKKEKQEKEEDEEKTQDRSNR